MRVVYGDLIARAISGSFDVIVHGCNCHQTMGAGIASTIKRKFPAASAADVATAKSSRAKLGTYSSATVTTENGCELTIVNGYTQFNYEGRGRLVEYDALRNVFKKVKSDFVGKRIGYPRIGSGLARGDWETIAKIIEEELLGEDHTLVEYTPK